MGWSLSTELRQSRRVSAELGLKFCTMGPGGADPAKPVHATTTNISTAGVAFLAHLAMPIGMRLQLEISVPGLEDALRAEGTIVRIVADHGEGSGIEYGVRFDKLEPRDALERYVRSVDILPLLRVMSKQKASDLHISVFSPPMLRIHRDLVPAHDKPLLPEAVEALIHGFLNVHQRRELHRRRGIAFPLTIPQVGRWHVNVMFQRGYVECSFHTINEEVPTVEQLGLPDSVKELALSEEGGLILVCGPYGSGKSSTLAALVDVINREQRRAILTLESPIEFVHENDQSFIRQREVGNDVLSHAEGIRQALLHDADVVMVSEITRRETAQMVLHAAEKGLRVLAAMSAPNALLGIEHLVAMLPTDERATALHSLSLSLRGVIGQRLLRRLDSAGLVLAAEVVTASEGVRNAIRTDKLDQIPSLMRSAPGSQPMDVCLRSLVLRRIVDLDTAVHHTPDPDRLRKAVTEHRG